MNSINKNKIQFLEIQQMSQTIRIITLIANLIFAGIILHMKIYMQFPLNWPIIIAIIALDIIMGLLFVSIKLETVVIQNELYIRYWPMVYSYKLIPLEDITSIQSVTYSPLGDYGGWGIRGTKKNRCYNAQGDQGVLINYTNGNRLLIGSQKPDELESTLRSILNPS